ncbi:hypothetical protein [Cytobacillus purgationiresistens]|uniref:Uncharacterized protein n=1 Tax=Cytobacillus purgationiresistens TaxID=863449 RepID=A0ABU0AQK9_9BACI|nr:hypothetical protein [Cytobacillus purgationiresistens]MDQ0273505.1 hypothetical protein [Cytobacillus purgationiresistens]
MEIHFKLSNCPSNIMYPVTIYQKCENGISKASVQVTIDELINTLQDKPTNLLNADDSRTQEKSTPALPFGTIRYSATDSKDVERVTMVIPKKIWEIRYGDKNDHFYSIGFPKMVAQYKCINTQKSKVIQEMRLYAVSGNGPINDDTDLYSFPYPNVGKSNGIVCWGQNQRLELESLVDLEKSFYWFVSAPFNEDYGVRTSLEIHNFRMLIETIEGQRFNDQWLLPLNMKYKDLFN